MKILFCSGIIIALASLFASCKKDNNSVSDEDKTFMVQATYANRAAITAGNLAATKGMRDSIRIFGAMMIMDHSIMQVMIDSLAVSPALPLPAMPDSIHQAIAKNLSNLSGYTFDTAYIHNQVKDQQNTIRLYQQEITNGNNVQVKNFAVGYLQKIQLHYNTAASISVSE